MDRLDSGLIFPIVRQFNEPAWPTAEQEESYLGHLSRALLGHLSEFEQWPENLASKMPKE